MENLAPCVVIVGPASSGKTTLVNCLNEALRREPSRPRTYVLKGSPDGTARYLAYAPDLREQVKATVKGQWTDETGLTLCEWIDNCRANLELVLLDFGGRHTERNREILERCSHFLVFARRLASAEDERRNGAASWAAACEEAGLRPVAELVSLIEAGTSHLSPDSTGLLRGTFRTDDPDAPESRKVVTQLVEALLSLRCPRPPVHYLDLQLARRWTVDDLADLAGQASALERLVCEGKEVVLGGATPAWAYAAAMHEALDRSPGHGISIYDPKLPYPGVVEIPRALTPTADNPLAQNLRIWWEAHEEPKGAILHVTLSRQDRSLPAAWARLAATAPLPQGAAPAGLILLSGAIPIWLHLAYSRWSRSLGRDRAIASWDASSKSAILVAGPGSPAQIPWAFPEAGATP